MSLDKSSNEYRMGWAHCYIAVLNSLDESLENESSIGDTVFKLMADVREVQK